MGHAAQECGGQSRLIRATLPRMRRILRRSDVPARFGPAPHAVRRGLVATLCAGALALAGCGGDGSVPEGAPDISDADRALGAEQHTALLAEFGGAYAGPQQAYVARIGERLADAAGLRGQCTFTLVNSDVVNAFAVPGCYIYVTRGLMAIVDSEAELASVVAHELGHIVGRHAQRQERRSLWRMLGVLAVSLTGSERLTELAGEAAQYFTLRYSRTQEYQSDDLGIGYLRAAGYDPYAAADMLAALGRQEGFVTTSGGRDEARSIPEWARSHPLTANRVERARDEARATGLADDALPENQAAYLRAVDGLLYGDDPEQGFVLGRRFLHPLMRIGFEAPEGFTLTNSPQAIQLSGPDGVRGEFGGGPMPEGGLDAYAQALLEQLLGSTQSEVGAPQRLSVNGVPAIVVPVRIATRDGAVPLAIAVYDGGHGGAYHFVMVSPPADASARAIAALFSSFRLLTPQQAAQLRPRVIRVVAAGPRDTEATLARQMADAHGAALFRLINGRTDAQPLHPGEPVKIVTYAGGR